MRSFVRLGAVAVAAGVLFGIASLVLFQPGPARSTALDLPPATVTVTSAFLVSTLADTPSPTAQSESTDTPVPSPTAIGPTDTPVPPTPSPTPSAPIKTGSAPAPSVNALSVVVIDQDSGAVLYSRDPHRHLAPASLTKIFTALVALQRGDLHKSITTQFDQSELVDSTLMGLKPGDTYTLEDLLYGLMLPSGNDAALAIANAIAGSEPQFADLMNAQAADLGLTDSHFVNAHGLDAPNHYSSAYDLAMAARYGMIHFPEFQALAKAKAWQVNGTKQYWLYNLNRFLRSYNGSDGVKIGYTDAAGPGIVASATKNGHRVFVALLHCGDIVGDSVPLFNWVWANFQWPNSSDAPTATPSATGGA